MFQSSRSELSDAITMSTVVSDNSFIKVVVAKSNTQPRRGRDVDEISMTSSQRDKPPALTTRRAHERRSIVSQPVSSEYSERASKRSRARTNLDVEISMIIQNESTLENDDLVLDEFDEEALRSAISTTVSQSVSQDTSRASFVIVNSRKITSAVWKYYTMSMNRGKKIAKCNYCTIKYVRIDGTARFRAHLLKDHKIEITTRLEARQTTYDDDVAAVLSRLLAMEKELKNRQTTEHMIAALNAKQLMYLYLR